MDSVMSKDIEFSFGSKSICMNAFNEDSKVINDFYVSLKEPGAYKDANKVNHKKR